METWLQIFYLIEDFVWMRWILQIDIVKNRRRILGGIMLFIMAFLFDMFVGFGFYGPPIWMLVKCIVFLQILEEPAWKNILKYIYSIWNIGMIVDIPVTIFQMICRHMEADPEKWEYVIFSECIQIVCLLAAAFYVEKSVAVKKTMKHLPVWYYVIAAVAGFSASLVNEWGGWSISQIKGVPDVILDVYDLGMLGLTEVLYGMGIAVVIINELRLQHLKEKQDKERLIEQEKLYYQTLEQHVMEVEKIRHDMKRHMTAVDCYLERGKVEEARKYLREENVKVNRMKEVVHHVGNHIVDVLIACECEKMGKDIRLKCEGALPQKYLMNDHDMCAIFSNLLSNAREACEKLKTKEKEIYLWLGESNERLLILVENPIEWKVDSEQVFGSTTKQEWRGHGYGLQNVKEAVERNRGMLEIDTDHGKFSVYIIL